MKPKISIASDYAVFTSKNLSAYYGYEETDKNDEWCFVAEFNGEKVTIPSSKLGLEDSFNVSGGLLMGIAWVTTKYAISPART